MKAISSDHRNPSVKAVKMLRIILSITLPFGKVCLPLYVNGKTEMHRTVIDPKSHGS